MLLESYFKGSIYGAEPLRKRKIIEFLNSHNIRRFDEMSNHQKVSALRVKIGNMRRLKKEQGRLCKR